MFKISKRKYEKNVNSEYITSDFSKKYLYNFYGEKVDSRLEYTATPTNIRNEAAKKIAILKHEAKSERRVDKKLVRKIKMKKEKEKSSKIKSANYSYVSSNKLISENIKNFNQNGDIQNLAKRFIKNEKSKIHDSLKFYNLQKTGIKNSGDSFEQKNAALLASYNLIKKTQEESSERIHILLKVVEDINNVELLKENETIKELIMKNQGIKDTYEKTSRTKDAVEAKMSESKAIEVSESKKTFRKAIQKEKEFITNKKLTKIETIMKIRQDRDVAIEKYKKDVNDKKEKSSKESHFFDNVAIYCSYYLKMIPIIFMITYLKITRNYKNDWTSKRFKVRTELFESLKENSITGSWNNEYFSEEAKNWSKGYLEVSTNEDKFVESFKIAKESFLELKEDTVQKKNILESIKTSRKKIMAEHKERISVLKGRYKNKEISKMAFLNDKRKSKIVVKDEFKKLKFRSNLFVSKNDMKEARKALWGSYSKTLKDTNVVSEYLIKKTPIEVAPGLRFLLMAVNMIFGGMAYIFSKQFKKGLIFLVVTIVFYSFFIPFIFGMSSVGGNGILGLHGLGTGVYRADARFFLVEGVYAFTLLIVLILYILVNAFAGYRLGLLMERGVRPNSWFISKKLLDRVHLPYLLSIPAVIVVIFTTIAPLVALVLLAFTNWGADANPTLGDPIKWVGFKNFTLLFEPRGVGPKLKSEFGGILAWTFIWGLSTWLVGTVINLFIALLVNSERIKFTAFWRTIMILPMAIPGFIMILMFRLLIAPPSGVGAPDAGPLYSLLVKMNLWSETITTKTGSVILNDAMKSRWFVRMFLIMLSFWFGIGGGALYFTGIMQGISPSLYEAAKVDGAGPWKQHKTITIPHLLFIIMPTLLPGFIMALNNYSLIWLFNDGGPEFPDGSITGAGQSDIILSWIYKLVKDPAQFRNSIGLTSVICIFFGAISILVSAPGVLKSKMFKEGNW